MRGHACRSGEPMVADRMSSCVACLTSGGLPATRVESFDQQFVAGDIQRTGAVLDEELNVLVDKGSLSGCRRLCWRSCEVFDGPWRSNPLASGGLSV
jgi:hypothetical protein